MEHIIVNITQVITSALALFLGILTWVKTRDAKWILLIIMSLVMYLMYMIHYLQRLGVLVVESLVIQLVLYNSPSLLLALVFVLYIRERPRR